MNKGFKGFRLINNLKSQKTNHHEEAILEEGAGDRDHDSHGHRNDTWHHRLYGL